MECSTLVQDGEDQCLIFMGHFLPNSHISSGSCAENELQLKACASSPPCIFCILFLIHLIRGQCIRDRKTDVLGPMYPSWNIYIYTDIYIHIYVYINECIYICTCMNSYINMHMYICMYFHKFVIHIHICTYIYMYVYICTYIHMFTNM